MRARLSEPTSPTDPRPAVEAVVDALYRAAIEDRDVRAMRLLIESVDGRAPLVVQHACEDPREMELGALGDVMAHMARQENQGFIPPPESVCNPKRPRLASA